MSDWTQRSDAEINEAVAQKIGNSTAYEFPSNRNPWVSHPRDFCNDPAAWGWLMEKYRMRIRPVKGGKWIGGGAMELETGRFQYCETSEKPGRAISVAFLESRDAER